MVCVPSEERNKFHNLCRKRQFTRANIFDRRLHIFCQRSNSLSILAGGSARYVGSDFCLVLSVQWLDRFASIYLEDPALSAEESARVGELQMRVIEALAFDKNLMRLCLLSQGVEDEVDQDAVTTYLAASNTSYSSTNLPRMGDR